MDTTAPKILEEIAEHARRSCHRSAPSRRWKSRVPLIKDGSSEVVQEAAPQELAEQTGKIPVPQINVEKVEASHLVPITNHGTSCGPPSATDDGGHREVDGAVCGHPTATVPQIMVDTVQFVHLPVPQIMEDTVKVGEIMEVVQVTPQELVELTVKLLLPKTPMMRTTLAMKPKTTVTTAHNGDENNDNSDHSTQWR